MFRLPDDRVSVSTLFGYASKFSIFSTLKLIYFSMFHFQIQYSLLIWGRAAKNHLRKLEILQNNILRAGLP